MLIKPLEIKEIRLTSLNSKNKTFDLEILFANDTPFKKTYALSPINLLPDIILKDVISSKKPEMEDSDDVLDVICNVYIKNDEEHIKECLLKFIVRLDQRLRNFKITKEANAYMKEFHSLSTYQEIIYKR